MWEEGCIYFLSLPLPGLSSQEGLVIRSGATKCWALGTPGCLLRRPGASLQPRRRSEGGGVGEGTRAMDLQLLPEKGCPPPRCVRRVSRTPQQLS